MTGKKPVGWRGEPVRHSKAARGIKTAVKHIRDAQVGLVWEGSRMTQSGAKKIDTDLQAALDALKLPEETKETTFNRPQGYAFYTSYKDSRDAQLEVERLHLDAMWNVRLLFAPDIQRWVIYRRKRPGF